VIHSKIRPRLRSNSNFNSGCMSVPGRMLRRTQDQLDVGVVYGVDERYFRAIVTSRRWGRTALGISQ